MVDEWARDHGGYWGSFQILARLTEELVEIAAVLQRLEGLRPRKVDVDLKAEVGDLLFTLVAFDNVCDVSQEHVVTDAMAKYGLRDRATGQTQKDNVCESRSLHPAPAKKP